MYEDALRAGGGTQPESFVVRFFVASDGSLHCRVTNVQRGVSWIVRNARELRALIDGHSVARGPAE